MVLRWTADATAELRRRIDRGQINPNFEDTPYLGDVVSGEHFPEYEALPPTGRQTAIVRFRRLFRRIKLERELQGQRRLAAEGGEEEGQLRLHRIRPQGIHREGQARGDGTGQAAGGGAQAGRGSRQDPMQCPPKLT
mgnify:CR=1 FL=1